MANVLNNTVCYTAGSMIKAATSFILLPIFANILGAEQYGIYNLLNTFSSILGTLMTLATERSLYRLYYDYKSESDKSGFLSTVFFTINIIGILMFVISIFTGQYIIKYIGNVNVYTVLLPTVAYTFFMSIINYCQILMQVEEHGKAYLKISLMIMFFFNMISLLLLFLYKRNVESLIYANLIANVIVVPFSLYNIRQKIRLDFDFKVLNNTLKYCLPMFFSVVIAWVLNASDRIFIGNLNSLSNAGIYSLAGKFIQLPILLCGAIFQAYGPYFYKITNTYSYEEARGKLSKYNNLITMYVCVITLCVVLLANIVLNLFFNNEYYECINYVYILAISCVFTQQTGLLNLMIYQDKKTVSLMIITVLAGIISVAFNIILIPRIGTIGACVSNLSVGLYLFFASYILARKNYFIPFKFNLLGTSVIVLLFLFMLDKLVPNIYIALLLKMLMLILYILYLYNYYIKGDFGNLSIMKGKIKSSFNFKFKSNS